MKILTLLTLIWFSVLQSYAQNSTSATNIIGKSFVSKTVISVTRYNQLSKNKVKNSDFLLKEGTKFFVSGVEEDGYIISVWNFADNDASKAKFYESRLEKKEVDSLKFSPYRILKSELGLVLKGNKQVSVAESLGSLEELAYIDSWANNLQFFISLKDFNDKTESIYPKQTSFTWGFLSLPIKARFGNKSAPFTFEEKINFGISLGYKWQHVGTTYKASNLLGGVSIANVKVDTDKSAAALSFSLGYMFQYDKFQAGLFSGFDFIDQQPKVNWGYQGKPWIGFAIGVSLFGENKTSISTGQSQ